MNQLFGIAKGEFLQVLWLAGPNLHLTAGWLFKTTARTRREPCVCELAVS